MASTYQTHQRSHCASYLNSIALYSEYGPFDFLAISREGITLAAVAVITPTHEKTWYQLKIWDVEEQKLRMTVGDEDGNLGWLTKLTMSADGKLVATYNWNEDKVVLWNTQTGQQVEKINKAGTSSAAFTPDGDILALGGDSAIWFWDIQSSTFLPSPIGTRSTCVDYLDYSDDGKTITSIGMGCDNFNFIVQTWDVANRKLLSEFASPDYVDLSSSAYSTKRGILVIPNGRGEMELWDTQSGKMVQTLSGFGIYIPMLFDPSGRFLCTGGDEEEVQVWDTITGQVVYRLPAGFAISLAFSLNGDVLAVGNHDGSIQIWDMSLLETISP